MRIFDVITLLGGLAMFLYGMRLMGDGLQESSSGALKRVMEKVTNNPIKAFFLGLVVTSIIQSSTATIVITSGLVAAGIITLHQSIGIIIGANVGTTVTGQIIRLLDLNTGATSWLQMFKPSTLAPVALILGIILIMAFRSKKYATIGKICIGFGVLFSGLLNMTNAVDALSKTGILESMFTQLSHNPFLGYLAGATVSFILQSSSATIGILQALSMSGQLTFNAIYTIILGVYLGDCVTTAIVCSIGAKVDARRVGIINILFNLCKTTLVLLVVTLLHKLGVLDSIWQMTVRSGQIANTNSIFNIGCAIALLPLLPAYERLSHKIIKERGGKTNPYTEKLDALNPNFYKTPALALRSCYDVLMAMLTAACKNICASFDLLEKYDAAAFDRVMDEERNIDLLTDRVSHYMVGLSQYLSEKEHVAILDEYYKLSNEFERLGDHATNIAQIADRLKDRGIRFSDDALRELRVMRALTEEILAAATRSFESRDADAAMTIEPMEEVVDDMVAALRENHLSRLLHNLCTVEVEPDYLNLLSDLERISDICSNIGIATILRVMPETTKSAHEYISYLHSGRDERFNLQYKSTHDNYFSRLRELAVKAK